jgi:uncharacterized ferredoxin-like protein
MNLQNLDRNELLALQQLINKALDQPKEKDVDDMIKEIIDEFNFDRVETAMDALDWQWRGETPTIKVLEDEAKRLLRGAAESRLGRFKDAHHDVAIKNACGGFEARAFCNEDKTKITGLDLAFVVESWDSSIEE